MNLEISKQTQLLYPMIRDVVEIISTYDPDPKSPNRLLSEENFNFVASLKELEKIIARIRKLISKELSDCS